MSTLTKEQVKEIIKGNNFQSVSDVSAYLKDIFNVYANIKVTPLGGKR